jgi:hypothetical protein
MAPKFELQVPGPLRGWLAETAAAGLGRTLATLRDRLAREAERARGLADEASRLELRLLRKLEPVIDDLGALVRLELEEARARLGRSSGSPPAPAASAASSGHAPGAAGPLVIDVEARRSAPAPDASGPSSGSAPGSSGRPSEPARED